MYTRPEFTKIVGSTPNQIRYYEEKGILIPDEIDVKSRRHYYSENAVAVYEQIQKLQRVGYSLDEIRFHMDGSDGLSDEEFFLVREKALMEQLGYLKAMRKEPVVKRSESKRRYKRPSVKKEKDGYEV